MLPFAAVVLGIGWRSDRWGMAILTAVPILLISMMTFILNDLHDRERDAVNHPTRPLPAGQVDERAAAIAFFVLLSFLLAFSYYYLEQKTQYTTFTLCIICVSYNSFVEFLPALKNFIVALASVLPLGLVAVYSPAPDDIILLAGCLFLFILGREILMDIRDLAGDGPTFAKMIGTGLALAISFSLQGGALLTLTIGAETALQMVAGLGATVLTVHTWRLIMTDNLDDGIRRMRWALAVCIPFLWPPAS